MMRKDRKEPWGAYSSLPAADRRWKKKPVPHEEELELKRLTDALQAPDDTYAWPPVLPETDKRGVDQVGHGYKPYHKAAKSKVGTAGNMFLFKAQGMSPFHSHVEQKLLLYLEQLPRVRAIRPQYAYWDAKKLQQYSAEGKRFPKSFVRTFDIAVTVDRPGSTELEEILFSAKSSAKLESDENGSIEARHERDQAAADLLECDFRVFTERAVPKLTHLNNARIAMYMCRVEIDEIEKLSPDAERFANALKATKAKGSLKRVITMVAKRPAFGWTVLEGLRHFAVAHVRGYLRWDHNSRLRHDLPMVLVGDESHVRNKAAAKKGKA
ncbi:PDDEXK family nuclease [Herbaspirillum camelliae]|uniref:hypothetical protein n=1 Tax=Herbaspirillum camelliae TaxID=1892903 RepID=UPI000A7966F0|nr:hypothetical protein [Herbaspirillum camelliae]